MPSKSGKDDELEEAKRIMSRLVKMPHKPHSPVKKKAAKKKPGRGSAGSGKA